MQLLVHMRQVHPWAHSIYLYYIVLLVTPLGSFSVVVKSLWCYLLSLVASHHHKNIAFLRTIVVEPLINLCIDHTIE